MATLRTRPGADHDRVVTYKYDGLGHVIEQKQLLPGGGSSTNTYTYGQADAYLHSNDVLHAEHITNLDGSTSTITYEYNSQGQVIQKDDAGTVHVYDYDALGRLTDDMIDSEGLADGDVCDLRTDYDVFGRPAVFTSYSYNTSATSQVVREYDAFGNVTAEHQQAGGVVTADSPTVFYTYDNGRLAGMTYPLTERQVAYDYGQAGSINDRLGRVSGIKEVTGGGSVTLESYQYLGLSTIVQRQQNQRGTTLSYIHQSGDTHSINDGGDQYTGLDRFGRVIDQWWFYTPGEGVKTTLDRFQYGYDGDSNRLYEDNLVNGDFSELYGLYDGLNRMTAFYRGDLGQITIGEVPDPDLDPADTWSFDAQSQRMNSDVTITEDGGDITQTKRTSGSNL